VLALLRFVGLVNAAVWLGAAVFLTFAAGPAMFSPEMADLLPRYHAGRVAQILLGRYFIFQYVCGGLAVLHLVAERIYAGRSPGRFGVLLLSLLVALGLAGGIWLQPKMRYLHAVKYAPNTTPAQKEAAAKSFGVWHGVSQSANLLMLGGVLVYFWRTANAVSLPRPLRSPRPLR
jgi:Domain of unknown function (DUF4149)